MWHCPNVAITFGGVPPLGQSYWPHLNMHECIQHHVQHGVSKKIHI